jgi:hypothetical protein
LAANEQGIINQALATSKVMDILKRKNKFMKTELEEAAERYVKSDLKKTPLYGMFNDTFIAGAKWKAKQDKNKYSEEDMINFAEFVAKYPDKNKNVNGEMLHAKSKYDGAERTIDLLQEWIEQFKKK